MKAIYYLVITFVLTLTLTGCSANNVETSHSSSADIILKTAQSKLGSSYKTGEEGPYKFDCSGFVYYVYAQADIKLPRTSYQQSKTGAKIFDKRKLKKGDLLFFDTSSRGKVNHSGIYIGNGKFIHASSGKAYSVTTSKLNTGFYKNRFKWGIRVKRNSN